MPETEINLAVTSPRLRMVFGYIEPELLIPERITLVVEEAARYHYFRTRGSSPLPGERLLALIRRVNGYFNAGTEPGPGETAMLAADVAAVLRDIDEF